MFVGREEEIKQILTYLNKDTQENIVIYGRRRIGKSYLIKETLSRISKPYIFYQAKETSIEDNILSLSEIIAKQYNLGSITFNSFESVLEFLFSKKEDLVFVIDEYPYLRDLSKGLDSVLQKMIDTYKDISPLKIVLLGSYIDVMSGLNEADNPLFGRISRMIFVGKMDYYDASLFYPSVDLETKVKYYSVFDGVPYYNSLINEQESFAENIKRIIIDSNSPLNGFIEFTLSKELRKINGANAIFSAIASGKEKFSDILTSLDSSMTSSRLSGVLNNLIGMDLITKVTPINELGKSKRTYYVINDNFIEFYYRYIYKNLSAKMILSSDDFYDELIKEDFDTQYVPRKFEKIAYEYLIKENKKGNIKPPLYKIGKYWYDNPKEKINGEFDVVSKDNNGYIVYEAKYTKNKVDEQVLLRLKEQLKKCGVKYYKLGFFSKAGFNLKNSEEYYLKTLEDVYR